MYQEIIQEVVAVDTSWIVMGYAILLVGMAALFVLVMRVTDFLDERALAAHGFNHTQARPRVHVRRRWRDHPMRKATANPSQWELNYA